MSKIKNDGLDQYGAEAFERQQFAAAGVEGVNATCHAEVYCTPNDATDVKSVTVVRSRRQRASFTNLSQRVSCSVIRASLVELLALSRRCKHANRPPATVDALDEVSSSVSSPDIHDKTRDIATAVNGSTARCVHYQHHIIIIIIIISRQSDLQQCRPVTYKHAIKQH